MKSKNEKFTECIEKINRDIQKNKEFIGDRLAIEFENKCFDIKGQLNNITEVNRTLKIGIVGEVKAGKSSFLNALIFEGDNILPKAATPMTAALTKIAYSKEQKAKIVFYKKYDWDNICRLSEKYDEFLESKFKEAEAEEEERKQFNLLNKEQHRRREITLESIEKRHRHEIPKEYTACKELTQMARKNGIDVYKYLDKTEDITGIENDKEYMQKLNEYVGSKGKLTPLVKHTELHINNDFLNEIEVIDTPGLNDPIISRSQETKKFLMECDVVFMLSYTGQFLGQEDMEFLRQTLPKEGIKKAILLGSKFDSGVLDYNERNATIKKAVRESVKNFSRAAEDNINEIIRSGRSNETINEVKKALPAEYISSLLYGAAVKLEKDIELTEDEKNIINKMQKRFTGFEKTPEFLREFANIDRIKNNVFTEVKEEKEKIISEKIIEIVDSKVVDFATILDDIDIDISNNLEQINTCESAELSEKKDVLIKKLSSIKSEVRNIFEHSIVEASRQINRIKLEVEKEVENNVDIGVTTTSETQSRSRRAGLFGLRTEYYDVTTTTNTADTDNVVENIRKYGNKVKRIITNELERAFDIDKLKKEIKNAVLEAFDLSNKNFNENEILLPIENTLKKLSIPKIEIDIEKYNEMIYSEFSSVVEGREISTLKLKQSNVLQKMMKDICNSIDEGEEKIAETLRIEGINFVSNVEKNLEDRVKHLDKLLKNKEQSIIELEEVRKLTRENKKEILAVRG